MTRRVRESELDATRKRAEVAEAHCERLRGALQRMVDEAAHLAGFSENTERQVIEALNETPAQSLREVRAEAGREGYVAGYTSAAMHFEGTAEGPGKERADKYADQIRRQGDE